MDLAAGRRAINRRGAQEIERNSLISQNHCIDAAPDEATMGLGETQVFQDEKSRLANTTVARIVAAKGSLNDPETKKECCRKLQKLRSRWSSRPAPRQELY